LAAVLAGSNVSITALASGLPGNLVTNGDFEQPQLATGSDGFFGAAYPQGSIPGWLPSGPCIELDNHVGVILPAVSGNQSAELDCDNTGRGGLYQDLPTQPGRNYLLRFAFAPRLGSDATQNVLDVYWNNAPLAPLFLDGSTTSVWQYYTYTLAATSTTTRLGFVDGGIVDGYGTELDDVSVVPTLTTGITLRPAQPNGTGGWYTKPVNVVVSATDPNNPGASVVTQCLLDPPTPPSSFASLAACPYLAAGAAVSANGVHTLYAASQDSAGNTDPAPVSTTFSIDASAPTANPSVEQPPNAAGWNNQPVAVDWNWTDNAGGSGLDSSCPADTVSSGQGAITVSAVCHDVAGNKTRASDAVQVDTSPPVTTATLAPGVNLTPPLTSIDGTGTISVLDPKSHIGTVVKKLPLTCWNTFGILVNLTATDSVSGVKSLTYAATGAQQIGATQVPATASVRIISNGATTLTFSATDVADNQEKNRAETVIVGKNYVCGASGAVANLPTSGVVTMANGLSFAYP
jgi:hypothetical protein